MDCTHEVVMMGMCGQCGMDLHALEKKSGVQTVSVQVEVHKTRTVVGKRTYAASNASVAIVGQLPELMVSDKLAKQMGQTDIERLLEKRQLVLLVDLDQTIVHTTNERVPENMKDVFHFQMQNGPYSVWYHTKLRPGTMKFLESVVNLFELHIVTFGSRLYAHTIAAFLDPEKKFFHATRILSRDECFSAYSKSANLADLFPCGDSMVCIIDDRDEVWNYASNLVRVKPYFYFANTGDINAPPSLSKTEKDSLIASSDVSLGHDVKKQKIDDEETIKAAKEKIEHQEIEDTDDYLLYLADILKNIHSKFYSLYDDYKKDPVNNSMPDVKEVASEMKKKVFQGCRIVFSGVVPRNLPVNRSRPYLMAKEFGAIVQQDIVAEPENERTTHVVAAYRNTAKVKAAEALCAKGEHVSIVTLPWLVTSVERWDKCDERLYLLAKEKEIKENVADESFTQEDHAGCSKTSPKTDNPGTSVEVDENVDDVEPEPIALSNDMIRSMSDEVMGALAEDGISLGSCSSDEEDEMVAIKFKKSPPKDIDLDKDVEDGGSTSSDELIANDNEEDEDDAL